MRISDWSSDVCSSDLLYPAATFNAGRTRHQGIEAGLDLKLTPWASLREVYQYSDFRFRDDAQFGDNRLPGVPRPFYRAVLKVGTEPPSRSEERPVGKEWCRNCRSSGWAAA